MKDNNIYNKLIFRKYKIESLIGKGSFGYVFKGYNVVDKESVAIKIEEYKKKGDSLESEAYFLFYLKGIGIPEVKSFGICGKYKVLVQTLLGESLEDIFTKLNYKFTIKDICMLAIQLMDRFEFIHSKYIIHRDIKPDNITVDYETAKIIYLIDFGLAKKYRSSRTGKHIKFSIPKRLNGTARYASKNALSGKEQSRRDDLEAIGYVLIYLAKEGYLPWKGLKASNKMERYKKIYYIKKTIAPEKLCSGLPEEFCEYIKYTKNLNFEEEPNYKYLRDLFIKILDKNNFKNDLIFSWIKYLQINKKNNCYDSINNVNTKKINLSKRRTSPRIRLIGSIQNSKEKNKNNEIKISEVKKEEEKLKNNIINENKINLDILNSKNNENDKKGNANDICGSQLTQFDVSVEIDESFEMGDKEKNKEKISKENANKEIKKYLQNEENLNTKDKIKIDKNIIKNINKSKEEKKDAFYINNDNNNNENNEANNSGIQVNRVYYNHIILSRSLSQNNINNDINNKERNNNIFIKKNETNTQKNINPIILLNNNLKENEKIKSDEKIKLITIFKKYNNFQDNTIFKNNSEKILNNNILNQKKERKEIIIKRNENCKFKKINNYTSIKGKNIIIINDNYNPNDLNTINNKNYQSLNNIYLKKLNNINKGEITNKKNNKKIRNNLNYSDIKIRKTRNLSNNNINGDKYDINYTDNKMENPNNILKHYYFNNNEYDTNNSYNIIIRDVKNIKNNRLNNEKMREIIRNNSNESKNILNNNSYFPINSKFDKINNIQKNDINISNNQIQTKILVNPINKRNELYIIPIKEQLSNNLKIKRNHSIQMNNVPLTNKSSKNTQFKNKRNYKINYNNEIYNLKINNYNTKKGYNFNHQSQKDFKNL